MAAMSPNAPAPGELACMKHPRIIASATVNGCPECAACSRQAERLAWNRVTWFDVPGRRNASR